MTGKGTGCAFSPSEIPPEPPPDRTSQIGNMGADKRSRDRVVDRQGLKGEEDSGRERQRVNSAEGEHRGREESRGVMDPPGKVEPVRIQELWVSGHHDDATHRWLHALKMEKTEMGTWPAPGGSVAGIHRPHSPTGVTELQDDQMIEGSECIIRMVGIGNGGEVVVRAMTVNGFLSDTGANLCMADSEENLVQCHDITPVSVGWH